MIKITPIWLILITLHDSCDKTSAHHQH